MKLLGKSGAQTGHCEHGDLGGAPDIGWGPCYGIPVGLSSHSHPASLPGPYLFKGGAGPKLFEVLHFFLQGPAQYLVPHPGPYFLWGTVWGPAIANQFHAGYAGFQHMLSNEHMPDHQR